MEYYLQPSENGFDPKNLTVSFEEPSWHSYADAKIRPNQIIQSVFGDALVLEVNNDHSVYCEFEFGERRTLQPNLLLLDHHQLTSAHESAQIEFNQSLRRGNRIMTLENDQPSLYRFIGISDKNPNMAIVKPIHKLLGVRGSANDHSDVAAYRLMPMSYIQQRDIGHPIDYISDPILGSALQRADEDGTLHALVQWVETKDGHDIIKTSHPGKKIDLRFLHLGIS